MLARVAREVFELQRKIDQLSDLVIRFVERLEFGNDPFGFLARFFRAAERVFQSEIERHFRNQFRDAVDLAVGHAEYATGVA